MEFDITAWSNGQIHSKLWLCEKLEDFIHNANEPQLIYILGGWYSLTAFLLLSRNDKNWQELHAANMRKIISYDIDPNATETANTINRAWRQKNIFRAYTKDCNNLDLTTPDVIVNTSIEHFSSFNWWLNIPDKKFVVLQSTNQEHEDHLITFENLKHFKNTFPLQTVFYADVKTFKFDDKEYERYMLIGEK